MSAENEAIKTPTPDDWIEPMPRPARIETMKATTLRLTTTGRKSGQERSIVSCVGPAVKTPFWLGVGWLVLRACLSWLATAVGAPSVS